MPVFLSRLCSLATFPVCVGHLHVCASCYFAAFGQSVIISLSLVMSRLFPADTINAFRLAYEPHMCMQAFGIGQRGSSAIRNKIRT